MTAIATGTLTGVQFFSAATPDGSWKRALAWCAALARGHRDRVLPASAVREFTLLSHPPASLAYLGHTASGLALVLADGQVYPLTRHALTHVAAMTSVPLALVESLIARGSRAIAALLTEQWHVVRQPSLVRVRVDCEAVRAIVSDEYGPMDLLPLLRTMEATWRARDLAPVRALHRADVTRLEFAVFVRAARQASPYTPGIILENSEVADRAVVLDAAMIGRRRYGLLDRMPFEPVRDVVWIENAFHRSGEYVNGNAHDAADQNIPDDPDIRPGPDGRCLRLESGQFYANLVVIASRQ